MLYPLASVSIVIQEREERVYIRISSIYHVKSSVVGFNELE